MMDDRTEEDITDTMGEFSVLIGGIAGDGINEAGLSVSRMLSRLGYCIYMYYDYPSLIRGGHNYSLVRASRKSIAAHSDRIDVMIALNQETVEKHRGRLKEISFVIYDADKVDGAGLTGCGIAVSGILKEAGALPVMKNTCILGGFARAVGIDWSVLEEVLRKHIPRRLEQNLLVARQGYDQADPFCALPKNPILAQGRLHSPASPILSGNQAIGLGLIKAGLGAYVAYPMTPSSSLLDFMARQAGRFGLAVIHPENEIAVMLMAEGFAYAGVKAAVGTSGGGFCLMAEGLSLSGMAELPVVVVMAQRAGPSTGLPTYTAQSDLNFIASAGQGEFPRFVVAPGDAAQAYYWSGVALNLAWRYQVPSFILTDKTLSESQYCFERGAAGEPVEASPLLWDGRGEFMRYRYTESGVSPLAFPPVKGQAVKTDSYMHDEKGITTEDASITRQMADKRLQKGRSLAAELEGYETVQTSSLHPSRTALLCWGSNQGVCREAGERLGLSVISVLVLQPFPERRLKEALDGVDRLIAVECNATGQLASLAESFGIPVSDRILKYDGRPFSIEDLLSELGRVLA